MKSSNFDRRKFIKETAAAAAGIALLSGLPKETLAAYEHLNKKTTFVEPDNLIMPNPIAPRLKFGVVGINHTHVNAMIEAVKRGGGEFVSFYAKEPDLSAAFAQKNPGVKIAKSENEVLEDPSIQVILSSIIPDERAPLGIRVMKHGKDYLVDKPGIITLEQLAEVRKIQKETKRIYNIMYSERFENRGTVKAGELVKAGEIGKVIQTIGIGPHQINPKTRPEWFWDKKRYGGIICDIGSHQFDQFLYFTGSTSAQVVASQVGNFHNTDHPLFEDFGDVLVRGNAGMGYVRNDWYTPDGLGSWGDGRLTILGTEGYIEVRKNIDVGLPDHAGNHVYMANQKGVQVIDASKGPLPFGELFVNDVLNRTETAMTQAHCFLATEIALKAQKNATMIDKLA
ncbi:MAG TPA: Gfo/Idh/MocA family oxidoreductase [Mucilaginibacter sp.]